MKLKKNARKKKIPSHLLFNSRERNFCPSCFIAPFASTRDSLSLPHSLRNSISWGAKSKNECHRNVKILKLYGSSKVMEKVVTYQVTIKSHLGVFPFSTVFSHNFSSLHFFLAANSRVAIIWITCIHSSIYTTYISCCREKKLSGATKWTQNIAMPLTFTGRSLTHSRWLYCGSLLWNGNWMRNR
jgi:hypothetical protein